LGPDFSYNCAGVGTFGFTGIAAAAAGIAEFLFFLFLVTCLMFFVIGISARRRVP